MKKPFRGPLFWAAVLGIAYGFFLAPISGALGGFLFLLTAWILPTAINLLLTAWLIGLLTARLTTKLAMAVAISFLLGINTHVFRYVLDVITPRDESMWILRSVPFVSGTPVDIRLRDTLSVSANPIVASVGIGGDEGCMCLYFTSHSPDWRARTLRVIGISTGEKMLIERPYELFPSDLSAGLHFDMHFEPDPIPDDKVEFTLDVFDGTQRVATFTQKGIYFDSAINERVGREKLLNTRWFTANAIDLLLHDNLWGIFAPQAAMQYSETDLKSFLQSVLRRQGSA